MFGWFNTQAATAFGQELATYFIEKLPPAAELNESKRASKTQYVLDKVAARVAAFKREQAPNMFQKARLANTVRWRMADAGYDKDYVETVVAWLVNRL